MKKLLLLLVVIITVWSCDNKPKPKSWNEQGQWIAGTFTVNDSIRIENKELLMARNEAGDSIEIFIRYDVIVNDNVSYQSYHSANHTKEQIIDDIETGYYQWLLLPIKPQIIKQYPIEKEEETPVKIFRSV